MSLAFFRRRSGRDDRAGRSPLRVATEVQSTVFRIARLTITAVLSFVLALAVLPAGGPEPLLAPLTALLVVQSSVYQTIRASILRVAAVTSGSWSRSWPRAPSGSPGGRSAWRSSPH